MSNTNKTRKRKYPEIKPVRASAQDAAATQRIMGRLMGREPLEPLPLSEDQPLPKSEPVGISQTPLENRTEPLQNEPVRKSEPLPKTEGVRLLPSDAPHFRFPYEVFDHSLKELKPAPRVVLERLFRLSAGWDSDECVVSINKLSEYCNIEETQLRKHLVLLEQRGFIKRIENVVGGRDLTMRGIRFRVNLPRIPLRKSEPLPKTEPLPKSEPNKEKHTLKETHTTQSDVRVGSRFSLEECQRYAAHLKTTGQGITNPGGYATKIYRSGEADALVEKFLNPDPMIDVSKCPDCEGKGYYFPDPSKPEMKRCTHERLQM